MKAHSERVSDKNMRPLCGRPLFHWILDALNDSGVVDEIIINTDLEEIASSKALRDAQNEKVNKIGSEADMSIITTMALYVLNFGVTWFFHGL